MNSGTTGKNTIVLAAGGTGGHIFPAEALAEELSRRGYNPVLITDKRFANYTGALTKYDCRFIHSGNLGGGIVKKLTGLARIQLGVLQAMILLRKLKPLAVVGFGGYPSFPTMIAAILSGIPRVLHEQNSILGRANQVLVKHVHTLATSFPEVRRVPESEKHKIILTGNPVRPGIVELFEQPYPKLTPGGILNVLVTGGSQGATVFSEVVPEAIAKLPVELQKRLSVCQQCRRADLEQAKTRYEPVHARIELSDFFTDMPARMAWSHLMICRAGASTLAEVMVAGRPAILVPYPQAMDDHQRVNATALEDAGGGWVMPQDAFTPDVLAHRLEAFLNLPAPLEEAAAKARSIAKLNAAPLLADAVLQTALSAGKTKQAA